MPRYTVYREYRGVERFHLDAADPEKAITTVERDGPERAGDEYLGFDRWIVVDDDDIVVFDTAEQVEDE